MRLGRPAGDKTMNFQSRSRESWWSRRHRSMSFDQSHKFKKDLPRINFRARAQRGRYLITGLGTPLNAPVLSGSRASAAGSRFFHWLRQPHLPISLTDLWSHQSYPISPSFWAHTSGSICFRPFLRHFLTPAASGPMKHLSILGTKIG